MNKGKILGLIATYHGFPAHGCSMTWLLNCPAAILGRQLGIMEPGRIRPELIAQELEIPIIQARNLFWMEGSDWVKFGRMSISQQKVYIVGVLEGLMETGRVEFPKFDVIPGSVS